MSPINFRTNLKLVLRRRLMIKCKNCNIIFQSYRDFNNHLFRKSNKLCKESYIVEKCECCNKKFKKFGLSFHILQYSKDCFNFYLNKYHEINNFPWKKLSDNKNKLIIKCKSCGLRCRSKNGISKHIFQHSKKCYNFYIQKYGYDRFYWPEDTFLKFSTCIDCGKKLGETSYRQSMYCKDCRSNKHNVMKIPEVAKKMADSLTITLNKPENILKSSLRAKERFKNNPKLSENQRQYMLNGGATKALKGVKNPSKPEIMLREMVLELYPDADPQHDVFNYSIDIALVEQKIAIEYDGYRHFFECTKVKKYTPEEYRRITKEYDDKRQKRIEGEGWTFLRYTMFDKFPTKEQVKNDIEKIIKR
jgi:very-short-patch-repair endonuclease